MKKADAHQNLNELVLTKMKDAGLRLTQSRLKILQLLEGTHKSMSSSEVFSQLQKKFKSEEFDRVTVYRILEKFEELEIVHSVGDGKYIYCTHQACGHDKHFIAICVRCGVVSDVGGTAKTLQVLSEFLEQEAKFRMTNDSIVVRGLCQKCR
jgi:Fe2+ or Zn2+ uptake regulation protein